MKRMKNNIKNLLLTKKVKMKKCLLFTVSIENLKTVKYYIFSKKTLLLCFIFRESSNLDIKILGLVDRRESYRKNI